ncbi:MAG: hypothetical protein AAGI46_06210 [Planctomycetota bacterium]
MSRFAAYTSSPEGFRVARGDMLTALTGLPAWGRAIVLLLAIPGIVLIALSLVALAASVAALLILTVPAYSLLRRLLGQPNRGQPQPGMMPKPPARKVEATVVRPTPD